jgi:hypothetical protein
MVTAEIWAERAIEWQRRMLGLICKRIEVVPFRGLYVKGKRGGSALDPDRVQYRSDDARSSAVLANREAAQASGFLLR